MDYWARRYRMAAARCRAGGPRGAAVDLPGDVDLVVLAVGADPQAPQNQRQNPSRPSLASGRSKTSEAADLVVPPRLLADAVDVHGVGLAHRRRQRTVQSAMAAIMATVTEYTAQAIAAGAAVRVSVESDGAVQVTLPLRARLRPPTRRCGSSRRGSSGAAARWLARPREVARTPGTVPVPRREAAARAAAGLHEGAPARRRAARARRTPEAAIERWYRRAARAEIAPRLDAAVARAGTAYTGLTIRGQRTRWASCSSTRRDVVQLAPPARPRGGPRLRGRARGLPPRGHGPLAALLGAARVARPDWREHAAGCAATARRW